MFYCPNCGSAAPALKPMTGEPSRYLCFKCQRIWHIANVIEEGAAGRVPLNVPTAQRFFLDEARALLVEINEYFRHNNPVDPSFHGFDDNSRTFKQRTAEVLGLDPRAKVLGLDSRPVKADDGGPV